MGKKTKTGLGLIALALLFAVFGTAMFGIVFMGAAIALVGIALCLFVWDKTAVVKGLAAGTGIYLIVFGILVGITPVIQKRFAVGERYTVIVVCIGLGLLLVGTGIYNISRLWNCRVKMEALYMGANRQQQRGAVYYIPRFSFCYEGKEIENTSGESFSKRRINKKFEAGKSYPIYVSAKNPYIFRTQRKPRLGDIFLIALGIAFCIVLFI